LRASAVPADIAAQLGTVDRRHTLGHFRDREADRRQLKRIKSEHRTGRNDLVGRAGDAINAILRKATISAAS
jgi:hypothetical protein